MVELEATLAPAEAEVGAVAKADQKEIYIAIQNTVMKINKRNLKDRHIFC